MTPDPGRAMRVLSRPGFVEARRIPGLRAVAILEAGIKTPGGAASGTGTDRLAVAAASGASPLRFAGLHTALGEAVGRAALGPGRSEPRAVSRRSYASPGIRSADAARAGYSAEMTP